MSIFHIIMSLHTMCNPYLVSFKCLISSNAKEIFHLTSHKKCLAIISSYAVLAYPIEELRPYKSACVLHATSPNMF